MLTASATSSRQIEESRIVSTWLTRLKSLLDDEDPASFDGALRAAGLTPNDLKSGDTTFKQQHLDATLISVRRQYPDITLRLFSRAELLDLGLVGYAAINSDDIGSAFRVLYQYHSLASDRYTDELTILDGMARICPVPFPMYADDYQNICEDSFSGNWRALQLLLGPNADASMIQVKVEFREPNHSNIYRDVLGPNCEFGAGVTGLFFPEKWLSLPVHRGSGTLSDVYQAMCERVLGPGKSTKDAALQVRRLLLSRSGRDMPSLEQAAESLRLTPTQLRKRLYRSGTSYKNLVLEIRMELARHYLLDTELTVQEIAYLLGYTTPAPFSRAFKRVYGQSPDHFRRAQPG